MFLFVYILNFNPCRHFDGQAAKMTILWLHYTQIVTKT